jgi:steroid delta-isomerase-like uncharacterized protein
MAPHGINRDDRQESDQISRRRALQGLGGGALAAAGLTSLRARAAAQATPAAIPDILQRWAAGWSAVGDPSLLLDLVTDDVVYEDVGVGVVIRGEADFEALVTEAGTAIPDFAVELLTGFATEEMAAAEYLISGTQTGDLPYLAASGNAFTVRASSVFVLADGLIQRESRYYDMVQFLTQLGGLNEATVAELGTPPAVPGGE